MFASATSCHVYRKVVKASRPLKKSRHLWKVGSQCKQVVNASRSLIKTSKSLRQVTAVLHVVLHDMTELC